MRRANQPAANAETQQTNLRKERSCRALQDRARVGNQQQQQGTEEMQYSITAIFKADLKAAWNPGFPTWPSTDDPNQWWWKTSRARRFYVWVPQRLLVLL